MKNAAHWRVFETVFEVYFSLRGREYALTDEQAEAMADLDELLSEMQSDQQGEQQGAGGVGDTMTPEELAEMLFKALAQGNEAMLKALARQAVRRYAGMEPGRPVGGTYYLYRTLRNLDLDGVLDKLMQQAREQAPEPLTPLEERLERDEYEARVDQLRKEIEAEIRRRLVADRGVEAMARTLRKPLPEDVDFMHASREEMAALRKAIYPLTRKLAVRLARKRRHGRKGPLDFRSTVRHSLSTGGVPIEPRFRYPRPSKPEIFVVADISGSVAAFARFTLHLVYAISNQFSKVRAFVFIDGIDEVTRLFEGTEDIGEAVHRVNTEADVIWVDGHSDYGHAFEVFWQRYGKDVGPRRPCCCWATPGTTTTPPSRGWSRRCSTGPATSTGSTPSPAATGTRATRSSASTPPTATACSSAATSASSSASSTTSSRPDRCRGCRGRRREPSGSSAVVERGAAPCVHDEATGFDGRTGDRCRRRVRSLVDDARTRLAQRLARRPAPRAGGRPATQAAGTRWWSRPTSSARPACSRPPASGTRRC